MANEGLCAAGPRVIPSVLSTTDRNFAYFKDLINAEVGGSSFTADSSPGIKDSPRAPWAARSHWLWWYLICAYLPGACDSLQPGWRILWDLSQGLELCKSRVCIWDLLALSGSLHEQHTSILVSFKSVSVWTGNSPHWKMIGPEAVEWINDQILWWNHDMMALLGVREK